MEVDGFIFLLLFIVGFVLGGWGCGIVFGIFDCVVSLVGDLIGRV